MDERWHVFYGKGNVDVYFIALKICMIYINSNSMGEMLEKDG